jgi:hypothetical protein
MAVNLAKGNLEIPVDQHFFEGKSEFDKAIFSVSPGIIDVAIGRETGRLLSGYDFNGRKHPFSLIRIYKHSFADSQESFTDEIYLSLHREFLCYARDKYDISGPIPAPWDQVKIACCLLEALLDVELTEAQAQERLDHGARRLEFLGQKEIGQQISSACNSARVRHRAERALLKLTLELMT